MENSFLQNLARELLESHGDHLEDLSVILPSRRARIFLIEAFKQEAKGASFLPSIRSMEDFISEISELNALDQFDLIFEFYSFYKELEGKKADNLDDFMGWASILIYDFNEIDRNLMDAEKVFGYLSEQKALERWSPEGEELSNYQRKYLDFWQRFIHYYQGLKDSLIKKKVAYQGMMYRQAIDELQEKGEALLGSKHYCFAGFNALTPAEEQLIEKIRTIRSVEEFWDADRYYLEDRMQEAGMFLRPQLKNNRNPRWISGGLLEDEKEIKVYGVSGNIGQAKLLGELLYQEGPKDPLQRAIVLADENLLLPVLESIPAEIGALNITMGYPVKQSSFYHFFYGFLKLFLPPRDGQSFYFKDLYRFLQDPFIKHLITASRLDESLEKLRSGDHLYISQNKIKVEINGDLLFLFDPKTELIDRLLQLTSNLKDSGRLEDVELEILFHFYKLFNRLKEISNKLKLSASSLMSIYRQQISRSQLSFVGEPLDGLQLMGVLESRTLDFDEIFLLSMNEGILPSGKSQNSLIPYNIKKEFDLPTYKEKDAIFAYHFYRLLQRAKKVHLIYNSSTNVLQGGERSRFIEQLLYELPRKNPKVRIEEVEVKPRQTLRSMQVESIEKTEEVIALIKQKIASGLSASAINSYLVCPLDFYYKYVVGLKEDKSREPDEDIEASDFGNLIHDSLEYLYADQVGMLLKEEDFKQMRKAGEEQLQRAFKNNGIHQWMHGKNKLVYEVCKTYLGQFFDLEIKRAQSSPILIKGIEQKIELKTELELSNGEKVSMGLNGKIDRIEECEGQKWIIDYKSGLVKSGDLEANDENTILEHKDHRFSKQLQLMLYRYLYEENVKEKGFNGGIISFRDLSSGILAMNDLGNEALMSILRTVIESMLNKNQMLEHNERAKYCSFCRDAKK